MNRKQRVCFTAGFLLLAAVLLFPGASWRYLHKLLNFLSIFWLMGSASDFLWTALGSYLLVAIVLIPYKVWRRLRASRIERNLSNQIKKKS